MNSAHAFSYAIAGGFTDQQMQKNAAYVNQNLMSAQAAGGWLAQQANKILDGFNEFLDSRAWEMGKRIRSGYEGDFVSYYDIGYLGSVDGINNAQGLMRNYIMANPNRMQGYLDGKVTGYDGEFQALCNGVGTDNYFYRKAVDGVLLLTKEEEEVKLTRTSYFETLGGQLSFRNREDIARTWRADDYHMLKGMFDVKSTKETVTVDVNDL